MRSRPSGWSDSSVPSIAHQMLEQSVGDGARTVNDMPKMPQWDDSKGRRKGSERWEPSEWNGVLNWRNERRRLGQHIMQWKCSRSSSRKTTLGTFTLYVTISRPRTIWIFCTMLFSQWVYMGKKCVVSQQLGYVPQYHSKRMRRSWKWDPITLSYFTRQ